MAYESIQAYESIKVILLTSTLSLVYLKWVLKETEKIKSYSVKLFEQATNLLDGLISFKKVVSILKIINTVLYIVDR